MKIIELAGIKIGFRAEFGISCDEKMNMFSVESKEEECDFVFDVKCGDFPQATDKKLVYQDPKVCVYEGKNVRLSYYRHPAREWEFCVVEKERRVWIYVLPRYKKYAENMWNLISKIELSSRLLEKQTLILHASFIIYEERAILFTGPSGIGKSTQAELWEKNMNSEIINGDRVLMRKKGEYLYAFGLPFSGSSGICANKEAPIRAIVILGQGDTNCVCRIAVAEAVKFLYSQVAVIRWKERDVMKTLGLLEELVIRVPVLKFTCRPEKEAVYALNDYFEKEEERRCEY